MTPGWNRGWSSCSPVERSCTGCRGSACVSESEVKVYTCSQRLESDSENCCCRPAGSCAQPSGPPEAGDFPCHPVSERGIRLWGW